MKTVLKSFFVRYTATIIIGFLVVTVLLITGGMISSMKNSIGQLGRIENPVENTSKEVIRVSMDEQYTIREYDGRIGVFLSGDTIPVRMVQVYVDHLPEADRIKLREGITVNTRAEMEAVVNDFSS